MRQSESIIISKRPLREADLLITFFSNEDGKMKGVARNAKKSRKRFGGLLESGYILDLNYSVSNKSDLVSISDAALITPKVHKQTSLPSTTALWLALEFADRFLPDAEKNGEKFELLKRFVTTIHEGRLTRPILIFFLLKWIGLCGYQPDLEECGYNFKADSLDILRRVMSGDIKCDINNPVFEDLMRFVFHYSLVLLGKPLKLESYFPILMEV